MRAKEFIVESTYEILRQLAKDADARSQAISDELNQFPKEEMGLTPDSVKQDPAWQKAKKEYDQAFAELRHYNGLINKITRKNTGPQEMLNVPQGIKYLRVVGKIQSRRRLS